MIKMRTIADPENVSITFHLDGVAQEADESLTLKLVPTPSTLRTIPTGEAVFFRSIIEVTILNVDGKSDTENLVLINSYDNNNCSLLPQLIRR